MEQELKLTVAVLQKSTQGVYTWFESLTKEETLEVLAHFTVQVRNNPEYAFITFVKNVLVEMSKTKTEKELFYFVSNTEGSNVVTQQVESHPLYANTKLAMAYFYKAIIAYYKQHPKDKMIKQVAKEFFELQYNSGIMEKEQWSDTDILEDAKF